MKKSPTYLFYVGSAGWEHPDWSECFYPAGLPPEWRLAYYNTAFPCAYLAYEQWSGRDLQTLAGWVEDTLEHFRLVLEANPAGATAADKTRLDVLAPRTGLVLAGPAQPDDQVIWLEGNPDLKRLAKSLQEHATRPDPVYLISRDHNLETMGRVKTLLEILRL